MHINFTIVFVIIWLYIDLVILVSAPVENCLQYDDSSGDCIRCANNYFLKENKCITCTSTIPYCSSCTNSTYCTSCYLDYIINQPQAYATNCIYCDDAIKNSICDQRCSQSKCLPCSESVWDSDLKSAVTNCKSYETTFPVYAYYAIAVAIVLILYLMYPRKKVFKITSENMIFPLHSKKCIYCLEDDIICPEIYQTNCKGFLCERCYNLVYESCATGNYLKCCFCKSLIICFIDYDNKVEVPYKTKKIIEKESNYLKQNATNNACNARLLEPAIIAPVTTPKISIEQKIDSEQALKDYKLSSSSRVPFQPNEVNDRIEFKENIESNKILNDSFNQDECSICLGKGLDCVIPCKCKPLHKLHKFCLVEYINKGYKDCPLCKSQLTLNEDI